MMDITVTEPFCLEIRDFILSRARRYFGQHPKENSNSPDD
jgi:hypothetical protein